MELSGLSGLYRSLDPVATVYLEARSPSEDAATQVTLRWHDLAEQLRTAGADEGTLAAIDATVKDNEYGWQQGTGRVVVASSAGVLLDAALDAAQGAGDEAYWTTLPQLGRYLREQARICRELLIVADKEGATVSELLVSPDNGTSEVGDRELQQRSGSEVHKPRGGALSNRRIQNRAEEAVLRQADEVIEHVEGATRRFRPDAIVLAGSVPARTAIRDELPAHLRALVVETEHGARAAGASEQPLDDELRAVADRIAADRGADALERLGSQQAHGLAAQGVWSITLAAQTGAIATLLLDDNHPVGDQLWVGPEPHHVSVNSEALAALDVDEPVEVDAESALVRCAAATGADLSTVPGTSAWTHSTPADSLSAAGSDSKGLNPDSSEAAGPESADSPLTEGVGALLRFDPGL